MRTTVKIVCFLALFFGVDFTLDRILLHGLNSAYGLNQYSQLLILGHSHITLATDKVRMEQELGIGISKYARPGVNASDRLKMAEQYLSSPYADSLKYVLYGVDQYTFTGEGLSANSYKLFYPFMDNRAIDNYIRLNSSFSDYWAHKLLRTTRYTDDQINSSISGWRRQWINRKQGSVNIPALQAKLADGKERSIDFNEELIEDFEKTVKMFTDRGVGVILVNTPIVDLVNDYQPESYSRIIGWFKSFAAESPSVRYWDFNPRHESDYDLFYDPIHLNVKGQQVITGELIELLKELESQQ